MGGSPLSNGLANQLISGVKEQCSLQGTPRSKPLKENLKSIPCIGGFFANFHHILYFIHFHHTTP